MVCGHCKVNLVLKSSGTWPGSILVYNLDYLVVAGGAGGGKGQVVTLVVEELLWKKLDGYRASGYGGLNYRGSMHRLIFQVLSSH